MIPADWLGNFAVQSEVPRGGTAHLPITLSYVTFTCCEYVLFVFDSSVSETEAPLWYSVQSCMGAIYFSVRCRSDLSFSLSSRFLDALAAFRFSRSAASAASNFTSHHTETWGSV